MNYIFSFESIVANSLHYAGGKGASLVKLKKAGLPVPDGYIILSGAFDADRMNPEAQIELESLLGCISDQCTYAVRSSALNEDGESASFAGAYETITNVSKNEIKNAVVSVAGSAENLRVQKYADRMSRSNSGIAVVIQRFIKAEFAGVLFTSDVISGSSAVMQGNYVRGDGESLVSGNANAETFTFDALKYSYNGNAEFKPYAKALYKAAVKIRRLYGCPMDIEWAVSGGRLFILQARPITTLNGFKRDSYEINGTLAGEFLLSKTNVGEIFMSPISPATYSLLETICETFGIPSFIDNVCGQAYCNISVICSLLVSLGFSKEKAYSMIKDIAGKIPDGVGIPIFPFDKGNFIRKMSKMFFSKLKKHGIKMSNSKFADKMADMADEMIDEIKSIGDTHTLLNYWNSYGNKFVLRVLGAISSSLKLKSLFGTQKKLEKIAGIELANELISGCTGVLESMKPLLMLEDVISGRMSRDEYIDVCGHRSVDEMELAKPYPYENPNYLEYAIEEHKKSGVDVHKMKERCEKQFDAAKQKFISLHPRKAKWLNKVTTEFFYAKQARESLRSKGVKMFCLIREYLLKASELTGLGDDIFMLYFHETLRLLDGDKDVLKNILLRKASYQKYLTYPAFPNIIRGRFEPKKWLSDINRRLDFYNAEGVSQCNSDIKGYSGAAGIVTGKVRVIMDLSEADSLENGEILVTIATNIGWTIIFPKAVAIITDIGAPLSHAAIVAREFGIPAVVGCGNATTLLKTGDIVRVDGASGTVEKLPNIL